MYEPDNPSQTIVAVREAWRRAARKQQEVQSFEICLLGFPCSCQICEGGMAQGSPQAAKRCRAFRYLVQLPYSFVMTAPHTDTSYSYRSLGLQGTQPWTPETPLGHSAATMRASQWRSFIGFILVLLLLPVLHLLKREQKCTVEAVLDYVKLEFFVVGAVLLLKNFLPWALQMKPVEVRRDRMLRARAAADPCLPLQTVTLADCNLGRL